MLRETLHLIALCCVGLILLVWVWIADWLGRRHHGPTLINYERQAWGLDGPHAGEARAGTLEDAPLPPPREIRVDPEGTPREDTYLAVPRPPAAFPASMPLPYGPARALAVDDAGEPYLMPCWHKLFAELEGRRHAD